MACFKPLKGWKDERNGGWVKEWGPTCRESMSVPCGQCVGCRIDHNNEWANRIVHEAHEWDQNCFVTLTYDDENLPYGLTLVPEHLQKFLKRLRKSRPGETIRFYACGEYGEETNRPHYHLCLFNCQFPDRDLYSNNNGNPLYTSDTLEKLWGKGFATIGSLTLESARYCAGYCFKKVNGKNSEKHYLRIVPETGELIDLEPEFSRMSNRPGIGKKYYEKYATDFFPENQTPVPGSGVHHGSPRYYQKLCREFDPERYERLKEKNQEHFDKYVYDFTDERLKMRETVAIKRREIYSQRGL